MFRAVFETFGRSSALILLGCSALCAQPSADGPRLARSEPEPLTIPQAEHLVNGSHPVSTGTVETNRNNSIHVSQFNQTIYGGIRVPAIIISGVRSQFSLLPPKDWFVQSFASKSKIRLVHPETSTLIELTIVEQSSPSSESWPDQIQLEHPAARINEAFSLSALGGSMPAFDVEWAVSGRAGSAARYVFAQYPGGYLECTLTGSSDDLSRWSPVFNQLLLSLRQASSGQKLEIQRVTPE